MPEQESLETTLNALPDVTELVRTGADTPVYEIAEITWKSGETTVMYVGGRNTHSYVHKDYLRPDDESIVLSPEITKDGFLQITRAYNFSRWEKELTEIVKYKKLTRCEEHKPKIIIDNRITELKKIIKDLETRNIRERLGGDGNYYVSGKCHAYNDVLFELLSMFPEIRDETDPAYSGLPPLPKDKKK